MIQPGADGAERRLTADLEAAAKIGAVPAGGVSRFAWTPALAQATAWVSSELERLGMTVGIDAAGNMIAKWPAPAGEAVMVASHLDTVPQGGAFDGALGVLAGVEAIRRLRDEAFQPVRPIWIGSFMDEEGTRFGTSMFGSRAFCGEDLSEELGASDRGGTTVREAMATQGFTADRIGEADQVASVGCYLELHIEQGPVLSSQGRRLGLVEAISGVVGLRVTLEGEANHAGTTPMNMRRDPLVAAARIVLALRERSAAQSGLLATVGRIEVAPGGRNVIPGSCQFTVDLRPRDPETFATLESWTAEVVAEAATTEGVQASVETEYALAPTTMDGALMAALEAAAADEQVAPLRMTSGSGHDAMIIGRHARAAMLFVPSHQGISHSPREWTDPEDCELGARVLAGALRRLARD
jgi:allantoate deiminase